VHALPQRLPRELFNQAQILDVVKSRNHVTDHPSGVPAPLDSRMHRLNEGGLRIQIEGDNPGCRAAFPESIRSVAEPSRRGSGKRQSWASDRNSSVSASSSVIMTQSRRSIATSVVRLPSHGIRRREAQQAK
jgi:hypothetical protein